MEGERKTDTVTDTSPLSGDEGGPKSGNKERE